MSSLVCAGCNAPAQDLVQSGGGGLRPITPKAMYSYLEDSGGHLWVCSVSVMDGSLYNCTTTGDSNHWNPDSTMALATLNGVTYGYVSDGNGLVWSCAIDETTGLTTHCNLNSPGVGQPEGVKILDLNGNNYAYIADGSSGSLVGCPVNESNGTFDSGCTTYRGTNWAANDIGFMTVGSSTQAFVADLIGNIWQCRVNSGTGSLDNCEINNGGFTWGSPFQFSFGVINGVRYIYVADLNKGFVTCKVSPDNGALSECAANKLGISGSYPSSVVLSSVGGVMKAFLTSSNANTWLCSVDQSNGQLSNCEQNNGSWSSDAAMQGLAIYSIFF